MGNKYQEMQHGKQLQVITRMKDALSVPSVMEQFKNSLGENAGSFTASLIEMISSDTNLQQCEPRAVIMEALKAASLKLPINKALGFAWIIPRKIRGKLTPVFQMGYRGYYQLAQRTGLYSYINTRTVPAGWKVDEDFKTGEINFIPADNPVEGKAVGYFACFVQKNGYQKEIFKSREWMENHVKTYVPGYDKEYSPWFGEGFDFMAEKTVGLRLLDKYGILSVEYLNLKPTGLSAAAEAAKNQNSLDFDIGEDGTVEDGEIITEDGEIIHKETEKKSSLPEEFD